MEDASQRGRFRVVQGGADAAAERRRARRQASGRIDNKAAEFERLYRENFKRVYNYVYSRFLDPTFAEDVTSEAFIKAARAFDSFDPQRAQFSTWVITIARNCATSLLRKRRPEVLESDSGVDLTMQSTTDTYDVFNDDEKVLKDLLSVLNDSERELMQLKFGQQMKNQEIAVVLGMNVSTVGTKVQRTVAKMRRAAEERGY